MSVVTDEENQARLERWNQEREERRARLQKKAEQRAALNNRNAKPGQKWVVENREVYLIDQNISPEPVPSSVETVEINYSGFWDRRDEVVPAFAEVNFRCQYCLVPAGIPCRIWNPQFRKPWSSEEPNKYYKGYCHGARKSRVDEILAAPRSR